MHPDRIDDSSPVHAAPAGGRLRRLARRLIDPVISGFREHGWSGKLFMISCGLTLGGMALAVVGGVVLGTAAAILGGRPAWVLGILVGAILVTFPLLWVQWRFLLGLARFERWSRIVAMVLTAGSGLGGLAMLAGGLGVRGLILGGAQTALSVQFLIYFARNGELFVSRRWEGAVAGDRIGGDGR